jgi:uncharacterized membrane-anchored protein YitT (DUF2179 family)
MIKIKNFITIILGTAVLAFGSAIFIVPCDLITGGVSSIAIVLDRLIGANIGVEMYITIITWFLFLLGLIFLGKKFVMKTLISSIFYPIFFALFYRLVDPSILNGLFMIQSSEYKDIAVLIAAIIGGALTGLGCALCFQVGGSTGGVDILAFLLCKIFKRIKSTYIIFAIDAIIIVAGVLIINDLVLSILGIVSALICSMVIDKVFLGTGTAYVAQIITTNPEDINNAVINKLDRTTTISDCVGGYSQQNKKMVIVSFNIREYPELMNIVNTADPNAFLFIHKAHEVHGEGWTRPSI